MSQPKQSRASKIQIEVKEIVPHTTFKTKSSQLATDADGGDLATDADGGDLTT